MLVGVSRQLSCLFPETTAYSITIYGVWLQLIATLSSHVSAASYIFISATNILFQLP